MTHVLVVEQKDGWSTKFSLLKQPTIFVDDSEIRITTDDSFEDSETISYFACPINNIKKYYFIEEDATAINDAKTDKQEVKVTYTDGQNVIVSGLAATDRLGLYALDGRKITAIVSEGGLANISLADLSAGVYVVNINSKHSFKIMKR
jgi:hypothetical protein